MKASRFLLLFALAAVAAAQSIPTPPGNLQPDAPRSGVQDDVQAGVQADVQPVDTTQLAAWLIGGVPSARLARLVAERGLATLPTNNELRQIESAGANKDLLRVLSSGNAQSARVGPPIPEALSRPRAKPGSSTSTKPKPTFARY